MTTIVAVTNRDMYRAAVISQRVQNDFVTGLQVAKLNELKARMRREVVKFAYLKKDGTLREAWGTCASNLMKATQNGRGLSGDQVYTVKYFDVEAGGYRSLRYENLVQVF